LPAEQIGSQDTRPLPGYFPSAGHDQRRSRPCYALPATDREIVDGDARWWPTSSDAPSAGPCRSARAPACPRPPRRIAGSPDD